MKLFEILDRGGDIAWHADIANRSTSRPVDISHPSSHARGWWLISREGKRLAGPFKDQDAAASFKANRPDRIPPTAIAKEFF